jgi:carbohydrate-selective porin OprB
MAFKQNYTGNKWKSYKTTKMQIFATLDKVSPNIGNIRGLNLVVVKQMTAQVTRLLLQQELLKIGHDLLY